MRQTIALLSILSILAAFTACTPEENNSGNNNDNDTTVHVTGISLDRPTASIKEGVSFTLIPTVTPDNADNKKVTWSSSSEAAATVDNNGKVTGVKAGRATITATTEDGGKKTTCVVSVKQPYTAVAGEAVDLGLSVKWSSMNLGATYPTSYWGFCYGDYFAWGGTSPKDKYNWKTYELCYGSLLFMRYNNISDSGIVDNKTEFKDYNYEDDAARQALGGKWRIPTPAEWTELIEQCTWTRTTEKGVNGIMVTSKINGNSIFLPAVGYRQETATVCIEGNGNDGYYWSSSADQPLPSWASCVQLYFKKVFNMNRCYGLSVRPVTD